MRRLARRESSGSIDASRASHRPPRGINVEFLLVSMGAARTGFLSVIRTAISTMRRAREDTKGRLQHPARLAQPQPPTLRISHFPNPRESTYQPVKIHLTRRGAVNFETRSVTRRTCTSIRCRSGMGESLPRNLVRGWEASPGSVVSDLAWRAAYAVGVSGRGRPARSPMRLAISSVTCSGGV